MSLNALYILSLLLPLVLLPMVLPSFVLMAHRKRITDGPSQRKHQEKPVAVMGGTLIMLVVGVTSVVINLFYDITPLFPVVCVMFMLYIFGMMDDTIGLTWKSKLILQMFAITLLYFGSDYGVHSLYGFFGLEMLESWQSFPITLFCGLMLLNAVNFADGIDGLASAIGILVGVIMGYWHMRHGFEIQTFISLIMVGVMFSFYIFNVFSERYKIYMGDSGSLVLGLFIYVLVCDDKISMLDGSFLADNYSLSFVMAVLSYILFDLTRVVLLRMIHRKAPYEGDRTHLHHIYVDMGMNHFMATNVILLSNIAVIAVWFVTAVVGMLVVPQLLLTLLAGVVFIWSPYFVIYNLRNKHISRYIALSNSFRKTSVHIDVFVDFVGHLIDGKPKKRIISKK